MCMFRIEIQAKRNAAQPPSPPSVTHHLSISQTGEADAITLDGGDIYTAGLHPYELQPIIAEDYGTGRLLVFITCNTVTDVKLTNLPDSIKVAHAHTHCFVLDCCIVTHTAY